MKTFKKVACLAILFVYSFCIGESYYAKCVASSRHVAWGLCVHGSEVQYACDVDGGNNLDVVRTCGSSSAYPTAEDIMEWQVACDRDIVKRGKVQIIPDVPRSYCQSFADNFQGVLDSLCQMNGAIIYTHSGPCPTGSGTTAQ